jgi:predicted small secreted protein
MKRWALLATLFLMALLVALLTGCVEETLRGPGRCYSIREMNGTVITRCYREEDRMARPCQEELRQQREQGKIVLWCKD